jgi:type III secretion protein Q
MSEIDALADRLNASGATSAGAGNMPFTGVLTKAAGTAVPFSLSGVTRMTTAQAHLSRLIGRGCHTGLSQDNASFSLHPAQDSEADWSDPLALEGPFGSIGLADGPRLLRGLTGIDPGTEPAADEERWNWMQAALIARLAGTPFADTERIVHDRQPENQGCTTVRIILRTAGHAIVTHARAAGADWIDLLGRTAWTQERLPFSAFADLPYETVITVARHILPRQALSGLAPGDFILPEKVYLGVRGVGLIRVGVLNAKVRFQEPNSFTISKAEVKLDSPELKRNDAQPGATPYIDQTPREPLADAAAMDNVPVTLDFELGNLRMSLGELRALGPDSVLGFNGSTASISIRCGDRLVGRGELVDVQGQLGVRIVEWGPKW